MGWIGESHVRVEMLTDGRTMRLLNPLAYEDCDGVIWHGVIGDMVDGASIPRFFGRFIGSPFVGKYRRASVIHDVYCQTRTVASWRVHRVFYRIMIEDGVARWKARIMWAAVATFGQTFMGSKWQN